jgi:hypothetical protein
MAAPLLNYEPTKPRSREGLRIVVLLTLLSLVVALPLTFRTRPTTTNGASGQVQLQTSSGVVLNREVTDSIFLLIKSSGMTPEIYTCPTTMPSSHSTGFHVLEWRQEKAVDSQFEDPPPPRSTTRPAHQ